MQRGDTIAYCPNVQRLHRGFIASRDKEVIHSSVHSELGRIVRPRHPKRSVIQKMPRIRVVAKIIHEETQSGASGGYERKTLAIRRPERIVNYTLRQ